MYHKYAPGPAGTSCLTCKRRRKKCDKGRPACERCVTSGFECFGYDHNDKGHSGSSSADSLHNSPRESSRQENKISYALLHQLSPLGFPDGAHPTIESGWTMFSPFIHSSLAEPSGTPTSASNSLCATPAPHLDQHITHVHDDGKDGSTSKYQSPLFFDSREPLPSWQALPSHQTHSAARSFAPAPGESVAHPSDSSQLAPPSFYPWQSLQSYGEQRMLSIPHSLTPASTDMANVINYVLTQYERLFALSYFKPVHNQVVRVRQSVSWRLQTSDATRWALYLGAKIFESLLEGILPQKNAAYDHWIQKYEHELHSTPTRALTHNQVQNRLCGALEIGFLKLRLNENFHMLHLLRSCAPIVFQLALSDPTLWPSDSNFTTFSVAHILGSNRYELSQYILLDAFCAMAYAVPLTLEYDTSYPPFNTDTHPVEWIHGYPVELHRAFIEINARCALSHVAPDWQDIERRIMSWQPCQHDPAEEAWRDVARLAVRESWRQSLLAYLYMAVCRAASDDPRVQSAVRQIFQLLETIRRPDPSTVGAQFFIQYLIAGACTPSEKRRVVVRSKMLEKFQNDLWLINGADFVPVLDHLWHGAAANGRPIRWSDYMASRQIALPIPI